MARRPATLSAYKPTLREQLAILGEKGYTALTGKEPGYEARDLINRYTGLADLLDVPGIALSASDAARSIGTRQYPQAAADVAGLALGAIPIAGPALKGAGKKVVKEGAEAAARAVKLAVKKPDLEKFMEDYLTSTAEHPFDPSSSVHGDYATTEVNPFDDEIHLSSIQTLKPKQGGGTRALNELTALADKHNVPITGIAKTYSNNPEHIQSNTKLRNWYKKNGFEILGGDKTEGYDIRYSPRAGQHVSPLAVKD